jgi:hypothetical protein
MRVCTVCSHGDRPAINAALVAGEPKRAIAARFGLSGSAAKRHAAESPACDVAEGRPL